MKKTRRDLFRTLFAAIAGRFAPAKSSAHGLTTGPVMSFDMTDETCRKILFGIGSLYGMGDAIDRAVLDEFNRTCELAAKVRREHVKGEKRREDVGKKDLIEIRRLTGQAEVRL